MTEAAGLQIRFHSSRNLLHGAGIDKVRGSDRHSLGAGKEEPLRVVGLDTMPGATIEVHFQSGDSAGTKTQVPVLDGTLPYYADLVPSAEKPEPTDTAAPAPQD